MPTQSPKNLKLYYSISEVAAEIGVTETLLRYWEHEFPEQIHPRKTPKGTRQFTRGDIESIRLVHNLVKVRGMKLAAARQALKKNREGEVQTLEVLDRLRTIKQELLSMKKALESMA